MRTQISVRAAVRSATAAAILVSLHFAARWWMGSAFGMSVALWIGALSLWAFVCGCMLAICIASVALILIFLRLMLGHPLRKAPQAAISAAGFLLVLVPLAMIGRQVNPNSPEKVAERSAPLVDAIRRFEADRGKPPAVLSELVPEYLPAIPGTGIRLAPEYDYTVGSGAYCDNPWMLSYSHPVVPNSLDSGGAQYYLPRGNYDDKECWIGGLNHTIESGWAHVAF